MRCGRWAILALVVCLFGTPAVRAGLYNTAEPEEAGPGNPNPKDINAFRLKITALRAIAAPKVDFDYPLRKRYMLVSELAGKGPTDRLTLEQKIDLGAVFMRRGRSDEALQLLLPLGRAQPDNPLLQSNLSMAYFLSGELRSASETAGAMLRGPWKPTWGELDRSQQEFLQRIGWAEPVYDYNRQVETYYVKLLRARLRASITHKGKPAEETLDPLFGDDKGPVRYVNEEGKFQPGRIAPAERARLPKNAIDLVRQLLIWMPHDPRLYWQLAELYNAEASAHKNEEADYLRAAYALLDDLVDNRKWNYRPPEVVAQHRALRDRVAQLADTSEQIFQNLQKDEKKRESEDTGFDWRTLLVGLGVGFVGGLLAAWQIREIRRRRQVRAPA